MRKAERIFIRDLLVRAIVYGTLITLLVYGIDQFRLRLALIQQPEAAWLGTRTQSRLPDGHYEILQEQILDGMRVVIHHDGAGRDFIYTTWLPKDAPSRFRIIAGRVI